MTCWNVVEKNGNFSVEKGDKYFANISQGVAGLIQLGLSDKKTHDLLRGASTPEEAAELVEQSMAPVEKPDKAGQKLQSKSRRIRH